ncbi:MAG: hypothetical protein E7678_05925 [Ruminococcaceae bacterium]|nr:hypothetical protein [Oscillospiraceae bacterium]
MKKRIVGCVLLLALAFLFTSCQKEKKTCEELLCAGLEYGVDNYSQNGYVFLKNVNEDSVFFMSQKTKKIMYGEKFESALNATKDFAIYVSASVPYEIAIFECYSKNDTADILRMCYERADEKKIGLRFGEWERASEKIEVQIYKKYVIFVFAESSEKNWGIINTVKALLN